MKRTLTFVGIFLIFLIGVGIMSYPLVSSVINNIDSRRNADAYMEDMKSLDEGDRSKLIKEADEYNQSLTGTIVLTDPFDKSQYKEIGVGYKKTFDTNGDGLIAYVDIPKIDVYLPVYHGTSLSVLSKGAGHLRNTSLPIGGKGTHSVISAHSNYPGETFFNYLTDVKKGDMFYLHVLGDTLSYKVDQIKVVLPEDTKDLLIEKDRDLVTLITCTPYGVNTHRLLVRGTRVKTPKKQESTLRVVSSNNDSMYIAGYKINYFAAIGGIAGFIAVVVTVVIVLVRLQRRPARSDRRKAGTEEKT